MTHFVERQAVLPFGRYDLGIHLFERVGWPGRPLEPVPFPKLITGLGRQEYAMAITRECGRRVGAMLDMPPRAGFAEDGSRYVRLWEALEIRVSADGRRLGERAIELHAKSTPCLNVNLSRPLSEARWLGVFENTFANVYHEIRPAMPVRCFPRWIGDWARPTLQRTYRGVIDFPALRRALLDFLAPDLLTRSIASRIVPGEVPGDRLFNWVGRHREALALTAIESPAWLPWLSLVPKDSWHRKPLDVLEERMRKAGITPGAFARLPEWGAAPILGIDRRVVIAALESYAALANLAERIRARGPMPEAFASAFADSALDWEGSVDHQRLRILFPDWFARALWNELRSGADAAAIEEELERAQSWLAIARPEPDANQRRAGWPWIVRQSARWPRYPVEMAARRADRMQAPPERLLLGPWVAVRLADREALVAEGAAMDNCLASHAQGFLEGGLLVYSIRNADSGERVACLSLMLREGDGDLEWAVDELAGRWNSSVPAEVQQLGTAVLRAVNEEPAGHRPP